MSYAFPTVWNWQSPAIPTRSSWSYARLFLRENGQGHVLFWGLMADAPALPGNRYVAYAWWKSCATRRIKHTVANKLL